MSVDEPSIQESAESGQSAVRVVSGYSATRRTARKHKRVVRQGTELFDADGVKLEPSDVLTERQRNADDDKRILGELPPHWGVFSSGSADVRLHTGGSDTFRPPEFHIFRMMVLRIRLGMPLRTDDGDDRAVFLGLQYGCRLMRRHGKHRKRVAVRIP